MVVLQTGTKEMVPKSCWCREENFPSAAVVFSMSYSEILGWVLKSLGTLEKSPKFEFFSVTTREGIDGVQARCGKQCFKEKR